jgi:hypothetical protein
MAGGASPTTSNYQQPIETIVAARKWQGKLSASSNNNTTLTKQLTTSSNNNNTTYLRPKLDTYNKYILSASSTSRTHK